MKIQNSNLKPTTQSRRLFYPKHNIQIKKDLIKSLIKEVLYNSLAQAIIKLIQTPFILIKIHLIIFVLGSTSLASYLVLQSFIEYFSFGVSTTSRTINETPTLFPKVTFCNFNPITTQYGFNLIKSNLSHGSLLLDEERKKLSHDLNEILFECSYNLKKCDENDFVWSFDETYGNCYTFNSGNDLNSVLKQSTIADQYFGLELTLYVNIYEKLMNLKGYVNGLGAVIRIGNSSYSTYYSNSGIFVSPGQNTFISISREFTSMLPKPYSNCEVEQESPKYLPGMDLYNLIADSTYAYTQQLCFIQCIQGYYLKKYNCTLPSVLSLYNASTCKWNYGDMIKYLNDIEHKSYVNNNCLSLCPLECNQTLYKAFTSFVQLNGDHYVPLLKNNTNVLLDFIERPLDRITARESIVKVYINYESFGYTVTSETPKMTIVSLLASIGGNLGLFLGVNFFSICEIIQVILEIYFTLKDRK